MTRCAKRYHVATLLLGALTPAEESQTMAHVAGCPSCQTTLSEFLRLPELLAHVPVSMLELIERSTQRDAARTPLAEAAPGQSSTGER